MAVLTHLSGENEVAPGQWHLEAGFGRLEGNHPTFAELDQAQHWISRRLAAGR